MPDYVATVTGSSGPPVVLLAGGASSSHRFFPGVEEALSDYRVVSFDRPGTGKAQDLGTASFTTGTAALASFLAELGAGPAVVVGQSLGGAQAVHFATTRSDLVAGLVLVDPTPLDAPEQLKLARRVFGAVGLPGRLPLVGKRAEKLMWNLLGGHGIIPEAREAWEVMSTSASFAVTVRALEKTDDEMVDLLGRLHHLDVPVVLLTADRKPDHAVRRSHERLIARIGGEIVAPPKAVHAQQLRDPKSVNELVLRVAREAAASRR
jgi:pimeloyl-ACP methyl ester carboxylesterase